MANEEHLAILKQGVEVWNAWREANPKVKPDLREANLFRARLRGSKLQDSTLERANLREADLFSVDLTGANLIEARFFQANLHSSFLERANLTRANLERVDLSECWLDMANLERANLANTNLERAGLFGTNLQRATLDESNLSGARLDLANLTEATISFTIFANLDLRMVYGLDTLHHRGPSTIGIDTLYRSQGQIPEIFLRGCGIPDSMIEYAHSLVAAQRPIDYYSCFISYSSKDATLAQRLYADLQAQGVRCWFAPHDMQIGEPILSGIERGIRLYDKLLLILSKASVESGWIEQEVHMALAREKAERRRVLFPIRIDDAVLDSRQGWPAVVRDTIHIGDFRQWKAHDAYQASFRRLLRDLKAERGST